MESSIAAESITPTIVRAATLESSAPFVQRPTHYQRGLIDADIDKYHVDDIDKDVIERDPHRFIKHEEGRGLHN